MKALRYLTGMIVLLLQLVLIHGYFYTDDTLTGGQELMFLVLLTSPLLGFIGEAAFIQRQRPVWRVVGRVAVVGIVLGTICGLTVRDYVKAEQAAAMQEE